MTKIAIILSGCGFLDGSEIYESVLTFLALDKLGIEYQCFAPDMNQTQNINYLTQQPTPNQIRNVLIESARLTRGEVEDLTQLDPNQFQGLIFPGGYGAALNLSDFGIKGADCTVLPDILKITKQFYQQQKPMGFICIAPSLIPKIIDAPVKLTIGNDKQTAETLEKMGACHMDCPVDSFIVDEEHKIVSTPAYMLGPNIASVAKGIEGLVSAVIEMI